MRAWQLSPMMRQWMRCLRNFAAAAAVVSRKLERGGGTEGVSGLDGDWFDLEFMSGGQSLAISGNSPQGDRSISTRILHLGSGPVDDPVGSPFGTVAVTVGENPLALRGIGVIQSGMTVAEAEAATGGTLVQFNELSGCSHALLAGDPNSPRFMVTTYQENGGPDLDWSDGTIVRIELGQGAETLSGIGIGSTKAEVLAAYGDRIEVTPHKYTFEQGGEYLTFVPADEADGDFRLVMETFDDVVTAVRSGLTGPVQWVEGCA